MREISVTVEFKVMERHIANKAYIPLKDNLTKTLSQ